MLSGWKSSDHNVLVFLRPDQPHTAVYGPTNLADVTISEVLCFIANKFSVLTKIQLKSILVGFYTEEELIVAKDGLFASSAKLNLMVCRVP